MTDLNEGGSQTPAPGFIDFNDVAGPPPARYDLEDLSRRLADQAQSWVPQLFPNGRREGSELRLANIRGGAPRKYGSCVIPLTGEYAGCFNDFDTKESGGPLKTLEHATGLTGRALFDYAASLVGLASPGARKKPAKRNSRAEEIEREINFILSHTRTLPGTPAATYLEARGLPLPVSPDLLFHPSATYHDTATGYPALIAVVRDVSGRPVAIHRTYLKVDGSAKAEIPKPRMMLGPVTGGAVRLVPLGALPVLGIAEGIETGLSAHAACPALPVWAALSAGSLERFEPPLQVTRIVLLADHDASGTGFKAAERAAARHVAAGRRVWIALPPQVGDDFNDMFRRDGVDAVRALIEGAPEWQMGTSQPADLISPPAGQRAGRFNAPSGTLATIRADDGNLARVAGYAWQALRAANTPPWLFLYSGRPAWIETDDQGTPLPMHMTDNRLRFALARVATWLRQSPAGELVPAHPPLPAVKDLLATPDPELPVLTGVVSVPVFGPDGTLQLVPGYYPSSRLLYEPPEGFSLPAIPERPTPADVAQARTLLLDELLGDFPFVGDAERAHTLALLLLPFVRPLIQGPTPLHLIEKPEAGTGAGLLVDLIALVVTNAAAMVMAEGTDEDEWRKRLTAKLRQAPTLLLIDNLRHHLDCSALAAAITATSWEDRILGVSETARIPVRCVWIATGNNPSFSHEIARRMVRIRMDAKTDEPWRRDAGAFRHPNIRQWTVDNRSSLIAACLILARAWIVSGRPDHPKTLGSFEHWTRVVGGILDVAGVPGFLGNLNDSYASADSENNAHRVFICAWWDRFGIQPVGTADLFVLSMTCDPSLALGDGSERSQKTKLGMLLGRLRDKVFRVGQQIVRVTALGIRHRAQQWALIQQQSKTTPSGCGREPGEPFNADTGPANGPINQGSPENTAPNQAVREPDERGEPFCGTSCAQTSDDEERGTWGTSVLGVRGTFGQGSPLGPPDFSGQNQRVREPDEPCEPYPPYTYARTYARICEEGGNGYQGSSGSLSDGSASEKSGEPQGEPRNPGSQLAAAVHPDTHTSALPSCYVEDL